MVPFAEAPCAALADIEGVEVPLGKLDVAFYRDDINLRPVLPEATTDVPFDIARQVVVLVVDVGWLAGGAMRRDCFFVSV